MRTKQRRRAAVPSGDAPASDIKKKSKGRAKYKDEIPKDIDEPIGLLDDPNDIKEPKHRIPPPDREVEISEKNIQTVKAKKKINKNVDESGEKKPQKGKKKKPIVEKVEIVNVKQKKGKVTKEKKKAEAEAEETVGVKEAEQSPVSVIKENVETSVMDDKAPPVTAILEEHELSSRSSSHDVSAASDRLFAVEKTGAQQYMEDAQRRLMMLQRFRSRWPEIRLPKLHTKPWKPPGPPTRPPPVEVKIPPVKTAEWVPPHTLPRAPRPRRAHIPPEQMTRLHENNKLKRIWHNFTLLDKNKMILQGHVACNVKKRSSYSGAQTACIAVMCRALNEEKPASELTARDVDDTITTGHKYYRQCMLGLKCYEGKPQLELKQLTPSFYFRDAKYTIKFGEGLHAPLAKKPADVTDTPDLMAVMGRRQGSKFSTILTLGDRHFLVWSPEERPVCYILDPHMLNEVGQPFKRNGCERHRGGAILRYASTGPLVQDLTANYGALDPHCPVPVVTLTDIEVEQRSPLARRAPYALDLRALAPHCGSEWASLHKNLLIDQKQKQGKYPTASLSAVSVATSRAHPAEKIKVFFHKEEVKPVAVPPVPPELAAVRAPAAAQDGPQDGPPLGEGHFFHKIPRRDCHAYGRDDMLPLPKSETKLHSLVDIANKNFHSQYHQLDVEKWILRGTRHMASKRYYTFKWYTGVACCVVALGMLRRLRARAWNEDTIDETLDAGWNFFRESLAERRGPVRRLVLGELKDSFAIRDKEYRHKMTNIVVWGRMVSTNPKVFDLCRGVEDFFRTNDAGILQVPGEYETAIWNEGGFYYLYHPWPADKYGYRVSLQGGGKACLLSFKRISSLCDYFLESARVFRRKPYSISAVYAWERPPMPEPVNQLKPVAPNRWVVRGSFHEGDTRFPEEHRNKQATPTSIAAIAYAHVVPPAEWDKDDVNESLIKGDQLYESTMEHLEKMGISLDKPEPGEEEGEPEATAAESLEPYSGMLAAGEVLDRFRITDEDCIVTEVLDGAYNGSLFPTDPGVLSLKQSLRELFKEHSHAVLTAHGRSVAVWKEDKNMYLFDPHGCDENGYPSEEPLAAACLVRLGGSVDELVKAVESNLPAGSDDTFNLSPVTVLKAKLNPELGAPEAKVESKAFEWIKRGTAAIMPGPRGETSAAGKIAQKAGIGDDDKAGRTLALPAVAAFAAAAAAVPPPHMHQDHMYNFLDAGADYYLEHLKNTGNKEIGIEDLNKKFELGANTFSIELEEAYSKRLPLRQPDEMPPAEGAEFVEPGEEVIEGHREMKELLTCLWNDQSKPTQTALLVGDYHQLGVWMSAGGLVVVFDPAPLLHRGMLTEHRIQKGDELRLKRIEDESEQPEDGELGADEAGGEEVPEPEPVITPVPPEATPALMVFASPAEFIDKLVHQAPLNNMQMIAPYKLYLVKVTNELTSVYKDRRPAPKTAKPPPRADANPEEEVEQEEEIVLVEALKESALGKYMTRAGRAVASVRGRVAQREDYFMEPQRDHQDAAISVMAIVVDSIEPYVHWRAELIDSIVMYGDRLYTISLPGAQRKPRVAASECANNMHLSCFNVKLETEAAAVTGDARAPGAGALLNLPRGITAFLEDHKYGVLCSKDYCVAIWRGLDGSSLCMFDPHCVGPAGRMSPVGGAGLVVFSCAEELAAAFKANVDILDRPGNAKYYITAVNVEWQYSGQAAQVPPASATSVVPDEGYEFKVLTAFSEIARDRTILRGSRPVDLPRFRCEAQLQSAAGAVAGACMARVRQPHLWTRRTVDQVMAVSNELFTQSISKLGYEFRPDDDLLLPLQVRQRFQLGTTYVRFDLHELYTGRLDPIKPDDVIFIAAVERFFARNTHGILWVAPHAVAIWRVPSAPHYYMFEPHACGPSGLRIDGQENGAACVLTFSTPKLLAFSFLQNYPREQRRKTIFHLYGMTIDVAPIRKLEGGDPPLVKAPPGANLVPATSKVGVDGRPRSASEKERRHPPGDALCLDVMRAIDARDKDEERLRGRRNANGWLVLQDGSQYVSAKHSIACRKFSRGSRGNQALACCVMAVAMSRVQEVCRWCAPTLDAVLLSGDQLYLDSYLHYRPSGPLLGMDQILRKFYTPGNCVCRVLIYEPRQTGFVHKNLVEKLTEFFKEEKCGVFEAGVGAFAVALFRTARGYYMFDPADRDRYGRAVPPPCVGHARACLSHYRTVQSLAEKLAPNIPLVFGEPTEEEKGASRTSKTGEPSTTQQPAVGEQPSSGEKPLSVEKPATVEKPLSVEKPSSGEKPSETAAANAPETAGSPNKSLIEIKKAESSVQKKLSPIMETGVPKEGQSGSANLPPEKSEKMESSATGYHVEPKGVRFPDTEFRIYGMEVTSLRKTETA